MEETLASAWRVTSRQVAAFFWRLPREHNICWFFFILDFVPLLFLPWSWRKLRTYETNLGQIHWKSKVMFSFCRKNPRGREWRKLHVFVMENKWRAEMPISDHQTCPSQLPIQMCYTGDRQLSNPNWIPFISCPLVLSTVILIDS